MGSKQLNEMAEAREATREAREAYAAEAKVPSEVTTGFVPLILTKDQAMTEDLIHGNVGSHGDGTCFEYTRAVDADGNKVPTKVTRDEAGNEQWFWPKYLGGNAISWDEIWSGAYGSYHAASVCPFVKG